MCFALDTQFLEILPVYPLKSPNLFNFREGHQKWRGRQQGGCFFRQGGANRQRYATGTLSSHLLYEYLLFYRGFHRLFFFFFFFFGATPTDCTRDEAATLNCRGFCWSPAGCTFGLFRSPPAGNIWEILVESGAPLLRLTTLVPKEDTDYVSLTPRCRVCRLCRVMLTYEIPL